MRNKWVCVILLGFLAIIGKAYAEEFVVSYDGFYDRLKVVEKGAYEFARVNFYVVENKKLTPCFIRSGKIITEKTESPLVYTEQAQLLLPYDKKLDKDKAILVMTPQNNLHVCQLKFQIEAEHFTMKNMNKADIFQLHHEFDDLLSGLSGFFVSKLMSFLLPEQKGVSVTFSHPVKVNDPAVHCEGAVCHFEINESWLDNGDVLLTDDLGLSILTVKPWIIK